VQPFAARKAIAWHLPAHTLLTVISIVNAVNPTTSPHSNTTLPVH